MADSEHKKIYNKNAREKALLEEAYSNVYKEEVVEESLRDVAPEKTLFGDRRKPPVEDAEIDFGYDKYPHSTRKAPTIELDITKIDDLDFDGIEGSDYPDFSNAFISSADYEEAPGKFRKLTDDEIDWVMDNHGDWFYEKLMDHIY